MSTNIEDEEELANWLGGYEEPLPLSSSTRMTKTKSKKRQRGGSSRTVNDLSDEIFIKTVQVLKEMGANGSDQLTHQSSRLNILNVLKNQMKLHAFMEWAIPRYTVFLDDIRKRAGVDYGQKITHDEQVKKLSASLRTEKQPFLFHHIWCLNLVLIAFEQHDQEQMNAHFDVLTHSIHETSSGFYDVHPIYRSELSVWFIFCGFLSWCPIAWPCKQPGVMQTTYLKYMFYNLDEHGTPPSVLFHILPIFAEEITFGPHGHGIQFVKFHVLHDIGHFRGASKLLEEATNEGFSRLSWKMLRQHLNFILAPNTDPIYKAVQMLCSILLFRAFHEDHNVRHAYWEEYFNNIGASLLGYGDGYTEMIYTSASVMPLIEFAAKKCDKKLLKLLLEPYTVVDKERWKLVDRGYFPLTDIEPHYERINQREERLLTKIFPNGKRMQLVQNSSMIVYANRLKPVIECVLRHYPALLNDSQFLWNEQNRLSSPLNDNSSRYISSSSSLSPSGTKSQRKTKRASVYPTIFTKRRRLTTKRLSK